MSLLTAVILSRQSEYGLEGLIVLARQPRGRVLLLREIARARRLPTGFLAGIFQKLRRHNLVASHRGAVRGYALARPPREISLREIFEAIEGPNLFERCAFRTRLCNEPDPCSLHVEWIALREKLQRAMDETSLEHVAAREPSPSAGARTRRRRKGA